MPGGILFRGRFWQVNGGTLNIHTVPKTIGNGLS